jgi:hypothetical protein
MLKAGANIQNQNVKDIPNPIKNVLVSLGIPTTTDVNPDNIVITRIIK